VHPRRRDIAVATEHQHHRARILLQQFHVIVGASEVADQSRNPAFRIHFGHDRQQGGAKVLRCAGHDPGQRLLSHQPHQVGVRTRRISIRLYAH
jgi:hypothetical protein